MVRWNMAKKGSREFIFEVDGIKTDYTNLKKLVEQELKTKGVKYTDNIQCYFNLNELVVYAVVNGSNTFKVSLCK